MAIVSNTYTRYDAKGIREDLSNTIHNISPEETPLLSNIPKETCSNTYYEWQTDSLAAASVSISPASALDAARVASDIVLMGRDIAPIAMALRIAGQSTRRIKENFAIAAVYNLIAVPVAMVGLATPLLAALAMSLSSITVTLNALRLK